MNYENEYKQENERVKKMSRLQIPMSIKRISKKEQKELMSSITGYSDIHIFKKCECPDIPADFTSESGSKYWYIKEKDTICIVRRSNHWGYIKDYYWYKEEPYNDINGEKYTGFVRFSIKQ